MQTTVIDKLEKLGFNAASSKLRKISEKKRKLALAYEHFRFVRQEKIDAFNDKLRKKTEKRMWNPIGVYTQWQTLAFVPLESWDRIPPDNVLVDLEAAQDRKCFDAYEVAHIQEVNNDPIIFGRIVGCPDRFFISQWDDDVKIEDILNANEG